VKELLRRMVAFIESEAKEKAQEIRVRAEEEFQVQRQSYVQAEKAKITKEYERKEKAEEVQRKIATSHSINQNRLKLLKAREDLIFKLYNDAKQQLNTVSRDPNTYKALLKQLILQGLLKLQETKVVVKVREVDLDLARDCLSDASSQFKAKTGREVTLSLDTVFLAPPAGANNKGESCAGGVVLHSFGGRVVCDNTLDQRLALSFEQRLPEIRKVLFGASTTRRFLN